MGNLTSRQHVGVEEMDIASNHAYKYPPRSGNYFGTHFIMGGERFDTPQPEAYLFGENFDLNFLGNRPTPFPYPPPQANEPTKTLRSLVNIRKESVRFVRAPDHVLKTHFPQDEPNHHKYNIEFTFDCDARCAITIYYFCTEEVTSSGLVYTSKLPSMNSETFHLKRGANQLFSQPTHVCDPSKYSEEELGYDIEKEIIPIAIHCLAEEGVDGEPRQSHTTIAVVDRHADGIYVLRALKQKLFVDGLCYLLQEIYGIENKNNENTKAASEDEAEDNGAECVICMCDVRDTLILPCRHLCLCNACADSLRYQANNCPICRAPFRALLQIRALNKSASCGSNANHGNHDNADQIPPGYDAVSLVEALNGPYTCHGPTMGQSLGLNGPQSADEPSAEATVQAAELLNRVEEGKGSPVESKGEYRLSVLVQRDDGTGRRGSSRGGRKTHKEAPKEEEREEEKVAQEPDQSVDVDSDVEKLSPLLVVKKAEPISIDDGGGDALPTVTTNAEDSEAFYTPDEPHPTPLYESDKDVTSLDGTPDRQPHTISLPGTPLSANSYSSAGSTRQLLHHNLAKQVKE